MSNTYLICLLVVLLINFLFTDLCAFSDVTAMVKVAKKVFTTVTLVYSYDGEIVPPIERLCSCVFYNLDVTFIIGLVLADDFSI